MTSRHDQSATLPWMHAGTERLLHTVATLEDLTAPSRLPGWTCAHVIGHVARNAEALTRLATWARTGVETPMYTDFAQRAAEIAASALKPAPALRADLASTVDVLDEALGALSAEQWTSAVRSALGRAIPAAEIPWMRIREVWLHALDLGAEVNLPAGVADLLLDDVTAALSRKDGCPAATLAPTDRTTTWRLATGGPVIEAPAAELAVWLTGRLPRADRPALPAWL